MTKKTGELPLATDGNVTAKVRTLLIGLTMENVIQLQLAELKDDVLSAAIPDASKRTALWCVSKLPSLYTQLRLTYENRYREEITRLVQGALHELLDSQAIGAAGRQLADRIIKRLQLLHERSGIPELNLPTPLSSPSRSRKARRTDDETK